ncbi:c-type cytochrome [Pandoraea norimbergensis]|uniref:Cytochrome c domain-containing protein n=1 Tax=Pandoraea norimbergensis TaxID=93219 RepID=A0ABN4JF53_9BURK|nr:hypothetical protein [Pandoraea norimbergensis]ALS59562.1 hypothetical protein AT302_07150 [Pandoraea norimbergensis]
MPALFILAMGMAVAASTALATPASSPIAGGASPDGTAAPTIVKAASPAFVTSPATPNSQPDWQARDWAMACMSCHNAAAPVSAGKASLSKLEGRPAAELVATLQALRNAKGDAARPATLMPQLLKGYRDEELQRIAAYFAAQPIPQPLPQSQSQPPALSRGVSARPAPEAARTPQ